MTNILICLGILFLMLLFSIVFGNILAFFFVGPIQRGVSGSAEAGRIAGVLYCEFIGKQSEERRAMCHEIHGDGFCKACRTMNNRGK